MHIYYYSAKGYGLKISISGKEENFMFICSMRMTRKKMMALIVVAIIMAAAVVCGVIYLQKGELPGISSSTSLKVSQQDDVAEYIRSFGWEIENEPSEIVNVMVPEEFNQVYENYNQIQKKQGFDLEKYKGMEAKRYTYVVMNYPNYPEHIRADVIVSGGKIIAADICSIELQGFIHGIRQKDAEEWAAEWEKNNMTSQQT